MTTCTKDRRYYTRLHLDISMIISAESDVDFSER